MNHSICEHCKELYKVHAVSAVFNFKPTYISLLVQGTYLAAAMH